jgi:hypothetical protein
MAHIANSGGKTLVKSFFGRTDLSKFGNVVFHYGWNDVLEGRGFRKDYDRWGDNVQLQYEQGRNAASHMQGVFGFIGKAPVNTGVMAVTEPLLAKAGYFEDLCLMRETRDKFTQRMARQQAIREMLEATDMPLEVEVY